jgi:NAD(P)-dependent dehydrogenase (short-subunit alcohol dehydrogenase family)
VTGNVTYDFAGVEVLVTGGTSGIGLATATAFADAGASVTITGTRPGPGSYPDLDLSRFGYQPLDAGDPASIDALVAATGSLDVLINNAGATFAAGRDEWEPDAFAVALAVNLASAQRLAVGCRDALGASRLPGGASVVNLTSMSAYVAQTMVPGYGAAKAGLIALTRTLAVAWAGQSIRVNAVAPGVIDTRMTAPLAQLPDLLDKELAHTAQGRLGRPDEVAAAICFLSSAAASYITGTVLAVDGGYLAI